MSRRVSLRPSDTYLHLVIDGCKFFNFPCEWFCHLKQLSWWGGVKLVVPFFSIIVFLFSLFFSFYYLNLNFCRVNILRGIASVSSFHTRNLPFVCLLLFFSSDTFVACNIFFVHQCTDNRIRRRLLAVKETTGKRKQKKSQTFWNNSITNKKKFIPLIFYRLRLDDDAVAMTVIMRMLRQGELYFK